MAVSASLFSFQAMGWRWGCLSEHTHLLPDSIQWIIRNPNPCPKISAKHVILHKWAGMRPAASVRTGRVKGQGMGFPILAGGPPRLPIYRSRLSAAPLCPNKEKAAVPPDRPFPAPNVCDQQLQDSNCRSLLEIMRLTWQKPRVKRHLATWKVNINIYC